MYHPLCPSIDVSLTARMKRIAEVLHGSEAPMTSSEVRDVLRIRQAELMRAWQAGRRQRLLVRVRLAQSHDRCIHAWRLAAEGERFLVEEHEKPAENWR